MQLDASPSLDDFRHQPSPDMNTGPLPLNEDSADKYKKLIVSGKLDEELQKSYQYAKALPVMLPAGITVPKRDLADVKKLLDKKQEEGIMFSATLKQLDISERAHSTIDYGRIGYIIEEAVTDARLKKLLGSIIVNIGEGEEQSSFARANKDAEVDGLCLLLFWHSSNNQEVLQRLIAVASDLVFEGRRLGSGSKVFAAKFDLMNSDEKSREAEAVSGWRKSIFLSEYLERVQAEGRFATEKKPVDKLMKAMTEDCTKIDGWNQETLDRYLSVGRRLS